MIAVSKIVLTRAEGRVWECITLEVAGFDQARRTLGDWARTAPDTGGYDKCDFVIHFVDGETYQGRVDLERKHVLGYDLRQHVIDFCTFHAGRTVSPWMGVERYQALLNQYGPELRADAARFLDVYFDGEATS